jgi:hypothetical protein
MTYDIHTHTTRIHTYIHTYTHTTHTYIHTHHTHIHTHTHTHMHTHTHTAHTYIHTHSTYIPPRPRMEKGARAVRDLRLQRGSSTTACSHIIVLGRADMGVWVGWMI